MRSWFALCWHFPAHFAECVESPIFPDPSLQRAWEEARDQDLDPPVTPPWFPAWLLIDHPGVATTIGLAAAPAIRNAPSTIWSRCVEATATGRISTTAGR